MLHFESINLGDVIVYLLKYSDIQVDDYRYHLFPEEMERSKYINHPAKKEEYIATRILRTKTFGLQPITYSEIGAPSINGVGYISISHSFNVVGIAVCKDFMVGLDLEPIRDKAMRVRSKFLNKEEERETDTSSIEEMTKVWSGKEALYKLAGRKEIIFKENLLLTKVDEERWEGRLNFPESIRKVELKIIKKDNFVISVNTTPAYEV